MIGTGELTATPFIGVLMESGNPHKAAAAGSGAAGTTVRFEGGVGVIGQLATFLGSPWQPANAPNITARTILPTSKLPRSTRPRPLRRIRPPKINRASGDHLLAVRNAAYSTATFTSNTSLTNLRSKSPDRARRCKAPVCSSHPFGTPHQSPPTSNSAGSGSTCRRCRFDRLP